MYSGMDAALNKSSAIQQQNVLHSVRQLIYFAPTKVRKNISILFFKVRIKRMKIKLLASSLLMVGALMAPSFAVAIPVLPPPTEAWATIYDLDTMASSINGNVTPSAGGYIPPTNTTTIPPFGTGTLAGGFNLIPPNLNTLVNQQETSTAVGAVDGHIHYFSGITLAVGQVFTDNFNIYEDLAHTILSDTLNIVFVGIAPLTNDGSNLSVDFHFLSENDQLSLPALVAGGLLGGASIGPHNINEIPGYDDLTHFISADVTTLGIGTNDFHLQYISVPEPTTTALLFAGLAGMGMIRRRKNKNS